MTQEDLISNYPCLYHMAEYGSWESIKRFGLLSTVALLDLFEITGSARVEIESSHRPTSVMINHPMYGSAVVRDQKPLNESALLKCLTAVSPSQWYESLNGKVFFWLSRERLIRLLSARAYREKSHCVLTVLTKALLRQHSKDITLSPINSGSTIFKPQPRGPETFVKISDYPFEKWSRKRRRCDAVVELAVDYSVPNISDMVIKVEHMVASDVTEIVYERE